MKIINIPIEPIEQRYSTQWAQWFLTEFKEARLHVETVHGGNTSGVIKDGSFLDVTETNIYKTSQLLQILQILADYDDSYPLILFFHDIWFPGLEAIAYVREGRNLKNLRICGCLHAGSYDSYDFLNKVGMTPWAKFMEYAWFNTIVDEIFVATHFHKNLIVETRGYRASNTPELRGKIHVTGFPIYQQSFVDKKMYSVKRPDTITFPHRLDTEKQPDLFVQIASVMQTEYPEWQWIVTKEHCSTKGEYYETLHNSKIAISFALQETWGIAMQEATLCGAIPLCPARLSYLEMYPYQFLYENTAHLREKIVEFMRNPPIISLARLQRFLAAKGEEAIPNIIKHLKKYDSQ